MELGLWEDTVIVSIYSAKPGGQVIAKMVLANDQLAGKPVRHEYCWTQSNITRTQQRLIKLLGWAAIKHPLLLQSILELK